jgi:hypothetical protein
MTLGRYGRSPDKSRQSGFMLSISATFFRREPALICFRVRLHR